MPWNSTAPLGTVSVKANRQILQDNTTYIEDSMGNDVVGTNNGTVRDHFWDVDPNLDGRHRFFQSVGFTVGGLPEDPVVGTGMDGVLFLKELSSIVSVAQQDVQPFYKFSDGQLMQMLSIRAMGVFNGSAATPAQGDVVYSHNLNLQTAGTPGIVRTALGLYTITFASALPSENYLVFVGGIRNANVSSDIITAGVQGNTVVSAVKSTTQVKIAFKANADNLRDPVQGWFVCFGG